MEDGKKAKKQGGKDGWKELDAQRQYVVIGTLALLYLFWIFFYCEFLM